MWIESDQYRDINSALERRSRDILERLFPNFLQPAIPPDNKPTLCPQCRKPLIRRAVPYVELFVSACPDHHGAWLSSDTAKKLRDFIHDELDVKKKKSIHFFSARPYLYSWLIISCVITLLAETPHILSRLAGVNSQGIVASKLGPHYWPVRVQEDWYPLTFEGAGIRSEDDRIYLDFIGLALEQGITNRLNLEDALKVKKSQEGYESLYHFFEENQLALLSLIGRVKVPEEWSEFHKHLLKAFGAQIQYYSDRISLLPDEAGRRPFGENENLKTCHRELLEAWENFISIYADPNHPLHVGIYKRLCAFDVI